MECPPGFCSEAIWLFVFMTLYGISMLAFFFPLSLLLLSSTVCPSSFDTSSSFIMFFHFLHTSKSQEYVNTVSQNPCQGVMSYVMRKCFYIHVNKLSVIQLYVQPCLTQHIRDFVPRVLSQLLLVLGRYYKSFSL